MSFFVNLPLSWIASDINVIDDFIKKGLQPELGLDTRVLFNQSPNWHKNIAEKIKNAGIECSIHLPFFDMHPGSENPHILKGTKLTLIMAAKVAKIYDAHHMVGHPIYNAGQHSEPKNPNIASKSWLKNSYDSWSAVIEAANGVPLYLENTMEKSPDPIIELVKQLNNKNETNIGICFDIAHWFFFSEGYKNNDAENWIKAFAPFIRHLHLHDNNAEKDSHLGLGQGKIPFNTVFQLLKQNNITARATLEPHSPNALEESLLFIKNKQIEEMALYL